VKHWRANEQKFAMYNGADAGGVARNESLTNVQRLYVQLYSDQLRNTIAYPYWYSKDYDKDVQRFCEENLSFTGSFNKATNGLLGSDANCVVRLQDSGNQKVKVGSFTPSKITITVRQGTDSESLWWQGSRWESSVPGRTFKDAKFNRFDNPAFEMRLVFPGTDYEYIKSWRAR